MPTLDEIQLNQLITWVILTHEGGFVYTDRKDDLGGPTYAGVSFRWFYKWYVNSPDYFGIDKEDFRDQFKETALNNDENLIDLIYEYYTDEFIKRAKISDLPEVIRKLVFSAAVNIDARDASKLLQRTLNELLKNNEFPLLIDGLIGDKTLSSLEDYFYSPAIENTFKDSGRTFINDFCHKWINHYAVLVKNVPSQRANLEGWLNRVWYFIK